MCAQQIYHFGYHHQGEACPALAGISPDGMRLLTLSSLGLAVPAGFVIAPAVSITKAALAVEIEKLQQYHQSTQAEFPTLLALRFMPQEGHSFYPPTLLNLGLNVKTRGLLAQKLGASQALALETRFILEYAAHMHQLDLENDELVREGLEGDSANNPYKDIYQQRSGRNFPENLLDQAWELLEQHKPHARILQLMIHGVELKGITVSRHPQTGEAAINQEPSLAGKSPTAAQELSLAATKLERHFKRPQHVHYALAQGKLWFLKVETAKLSVQAEIKFLVDLVRDEILTDREALLQINPLALDQFLHPTLDHTIVKDVLATGLGASPGAATGHLVFSTQEAQRLKAEGLKVVLLRSETSPEDVQAMHLSEGIITTRGGQLSHAAVIARGMGKPCIVAAKNLRLDEKEHKVRVDNIMLAQGDLITLDGTTGHIYRGEIPTVPPSLSGDFATILRWSDRYRRMFVRANADTPQDARTAKAFGAEGVGLCRTEHMFFSPQRITTMRRMILSETAEERRRALTEILPMQRRDFIEFFEIMAELPVTIRLLDPPLHEFLPKNNEEIRALAEEFNMPVPELQRRVSELQEFNPMLGHRGVRLAISYPEIAEMQVRAIFEAAAYVGRKLGKSPIPEIMIPLVIGRTEMEYLHQRILTVAEEVRAETGLILPFHIGAMIELPRAALRAGEIAHVAEFISFGTNDLTQTTLGMSRDDSVRFIRHYTTQGILKHDPFATLDQEGVGELMRMAVQRGRATRASLQAGICGEHAGDPESIAFCESINLDYVSCSPFRIAIARLAAAQASLRARA